MICLKCNSFHAGFVGRLCPVCSEPLQLETNTNRDKLVLGRLKDYLRLWQKSGQVSKNSVTEIEAAIDNTDLLEVEQEKIQTFSFLSICLDWFNGLLMGFIANLSALFEPMIVTPNANKYRKKYSGKNSEASYESVTEGILFGENSNLSGLDAISELDSGRGRGSGRNSGLQPTVLSNALWSGLRPLFNEYIWWFIGSLLVVTGSIMGIREAWLVLTGVSRHLTVLSAVFVYQILFMALGLFLGSKSLLTGRLLSGISLLLMPVSFSVVSDVFVTNFILGFITLGLLVGLTSIVLNVIGKQFQIEFSPFFLSILPSMICLSLIPYFGFEVSSLILCFIPLGFVSYSGKSFIEGKSGGLFLYSIYGSIAVILTYSNQYWDSDSFFQLGSLSLGISFYWVFALSSILIMTFGGLKSDIKKIYIVLEILFLALTLVLAGVSGIYIFTTQSGLENTQWVRYLYIGLPFFVSLLFFDTISRNEFSLHPFMVLVISAFYLFFQELFPSSNWSIYFAGIVPVTGMLFAKDEFPRMKLMLLSWGVFSGVISCLILIYLSQLPQGVSGLKLFQTPNLFLLSSLPLLIDGIYFGVISHLVAKWSKSILHVLAVIGTYTFFYAIVFYFFPITDIFSRVGVSFGLVSIFYYFIANEFESRSAKVNQTNYDITFFPMDDISLLSGLFSLVALFFVFTPTSSLENSIVLVTGLIMISRSFRDLSSLSSFVGGLLVSLALFRFSFSFFENQSISVNLFISSSLSFGFGFICLFFPNLNPVEVKSRKAFFVLRLPFSAQGPVLVRNALSAVSLLYVFYSVGLIFIWLGLSDLPQRNLVILSGFLLALLFVFAFFTRAFNSFYLRGSTVSLAVLFFLVGLTAITNRIGRPLPPTVVGVNLTLVIIGLWLFSRLLFHKGQSLANWLDNPTQGIYYHHVPLTSMLLLGLVLILDVFLLLPYSISRFLYITPPSFLIGAGLTFFFYSRSTHSFIPLNIALGLFIIASALGFSQDSLIGTKLVPLDLPGGRWVPLSTESATRLGNWVDPTIFLPQSLTESLLIIKASLGIGVAGFVYALCLVLFPLASLGMAVRKILFALEDYLPLQFIFSTWSVICLLVLSLISIQYALITPAIFTFVAGAILLASGFSKEGNFSIALSGILILHGVIHQNSTYPIWGGPVFAFVALSMVLLVKPVSLFSKKPYSRILESSHLGALLYSTIGFIFALATLSNVTWDNAVPGLLSGAYFGLSELWVQTFSLGLTFLFIGFSFIFASIQWTQSPTTILSYLSVLSFAFAGITGFPYFCQFGICSGANSIQVLPEMIPYFGLIFVCVSGLSYLFSEIYKTKREDFSIGLGFGSDTLILLIGVLLVVFIRSSIVSSLYWSNLALTATIAVVILLTLVISFRNLQARHLYFTQTSIASLYFVLKQFFPETFTPEIDGVAALVFGFILLGITNIAHKVGIPPLEESTRRFSALMPIVAVIVLPTEVSYQKAGFATFSAILYSALAITSSHKIYAVLSAVAGNFAIFTAILAADVQGLEIYLAPLGLFFLFLSHIFRENLTDQAKKLVRIIGGLLLYFPAAVNISFEMGRAVNPMYAVYFGFLCLVGILFGMIFQIRSYLFMGVIFFTLNLIANLLQSGLRDQKMGFILLSLSGLFIIGSLVTYTLKKDQILEILGRAKEKLAKWE